MASKSQEFVERLDKLQKKDESLTKKAQLVTDKQEQMQQYFSATNTAQSTAAGGGQWTTGGMTYTPYPNTANPNTYHTNIPANPYNTSTPNTTFPYSFDPTEALKEQITLMEEKIDVIAEKMDLLLEVIDYLQLEGKHGN